MQRWVPILDHGGSSLVAAAKSSAAQVVAQLQSGDSGLSTPEAKRRLSIYGANAIRRHGVSTLSILLNQLRNPLLILLAATTVVSMITGDVTDAGIILAMVGLSVGLGFINEYRSARVIEDLYEAIHHRALLLRDGQQVTVDVTEIVPGDIVLLRTGDLVPADLRLLDAKELECDQAVLTGEAMPKYKQADPDSGTDLTELNLRSVAYMGTVVRSGSGRGIVLQTGSRTVFGKIALRLGERQPVTAFQRGLTGFSLFLVRVTAVLAGTIFLLNWLLLHRPLLQSALFALAIAVGLTPQLLPAIVTVSLSTGARNLARKKVIVKRLISIEDLGNVEVLFTDKTGTLTKGQVSFQAAIDPEGRPSADVLRLGLLNATSAGADPAVSPAWA